MKCNQFKSVFGICASAIVLAATAPSVKAAENISLSYQGSSVNVTRGELESFTETGILPTAIQNLLGSNPDVPVVVRNLLNREITVPGFVEKFLSSATGEFALSQLDTTIGNASGKTSNDLSDLKLAFGQAASDRRVSFMELVRAYPQRNVRVDLNSLEGTYNRVANFVEKVEPALAVAKSFLSDIICDCNTASITPHSPALNVSASVPTQQGQPCNTEASVTAEADEGTQPVMAEESSEIHIAAQ